jgi:hypothetical protein
LPADSRDQPVPPDGVVARVDLAGSVLVLGDPAGMTIAPADGRGSADSLTQALEQERKEREPAAAGVVPLADAVEDAEQVMGKVERAVKLFTEIAQGRLDPAAVSDEVDALVGLLGRLDRDERWTEALRMARSLAMLLALLGRWLELLKSLKLALGAAEQLGDVSGQAWALHELGTLHLAAGERAEAERLLSQARAMREQIGDRHGLGMTDRNLQFLCRDLRALIHCEAGESVFEWLRHKPIAALALGAAMLLAGGVAGAFIGGAGGTAVTVTETGPTTTVTITRTVRVRPPTPTPTSTLSIKRTGSGTVTSNDETIDCGSSCSHTYTTGAKVTLTATPTAGSTFTGWIGACSGTGTCSLTINEDESVSAAFALASATLTVSTSGTGSGSVTSADERIDCGTACSSTYTSGTAVTLTATPEAGSVFKGWGGHACTGTGPCLLKLTADESVVAEFAPAGLR